MLPLSLAIRSRRNSSTPRIAPQQPIREADADDNGAEVVAQMGNVPTYLPIFRRFGQQAGCSFG